MGRVCGYTAIPSLTDACSNCELNCRGTAELPREDPQLVPALAWWVIWSGVERSLLPRKIAYSAGDDSVAPPVKRGLKRSIAETCAGQSTSSLGYGCYSGISPNFFYNRCALKIRQLVHCFPIDVVRAAAMAMAMAAWNMPGFQPLRQHGRIQLRGLRRSSGHAPDSPNGVSLGLLD
jgi:hypothetical protein